MKPQQTKLAQVLQVDRDIANQLAQNLGTLSADYKYLIPAAPAAQTGEK